MDLPLLLVVWAGFGLALMSPGPNFAMLLGIAVRDGRTVALSAALGMAAGEVVWGFAAVFGLTALAAAHPQAMTLLAWAGGTYLMYLGVRHWMSAWRGEAAEIWEDTTQRPGGGFGRGLAVMLLNGKAGVFWAALAGVLVQGGAGKATMVVAVLGATAMSLAWHGMLAMVLSADAVARFYRRIQRGFDAVLGTVLVGLGVRLLVPS
jgi:threonine/homoserine/homoserine lactone efflux protein